MLIRKRRTVPEIIPILEATLRNISPRHSERERLGRELASRRSGYHGELTMDYYLNQCSVANQFIFHDLRLPHSKTEFFQMDSLLLANRFFIPFEAKNLNGTLLFEEHQVEQTYQNQIQVYPNPLVQAENQLFHLNNLIKEHLNKDLPGTYFVVITNPSSSIKFDPSYKQIAAPKIIRPPSLRKKIELFSKQHPIPLLTTDEFHYLANLLLTLHTPPNYDIFTKFNIRKKDILPGLHCPDCNMLSVMRRHGRWVCRKCNGIHEKAHIQGLVDYYYLMGDKITNKQLRAFFNLKSRSVAAKLLASFDLPYSGKYKDRVYHLSLEKLKKLL